METVLVVEDDRAYARITTNWLVKNGINARYVLSVDSAKGFLEGYEVDLVLSDLRLNNSNGVELLEWMKAQGYRMPFLIMTGYGDILSAVEAMKKGAADYLPKPVQTERVLGIIRGLLDCGNRKKVKGRAFYVGKSPLAVKLQNIVRVVAPADSLSILIRGASGTGKEYVARQIHVLSGRSDASFIAVDCGVLPKELAASELFGHMKGAFTGATENKTGMFAAANHGTLFLDEVGNLNAEVQRALLRALQEKRYRPVGGKEEIQTDIRLVAATNEDLEKAIAEGRFREDLFHRLNYTKIELAFMRQACNGMAEDCRNILYDVFIDKTLALLDAEAEILKEMLRHGTVSAGFHAEAVRGSGRKTSVTLTWNGTDSDLIELVAALMAAGAIGTAEGRDLKIVDVIRVFEEVFHLKINALYTKRGKVFDRCTDTTPFIDSLRKSYNRMLDARLA